MKVGNYNYSKDREATFSAVMVIATGLAALLALVLKLYYVM